jgi:hypothetical protein
MLPRPRPRLCFPASLSLVIPLVVLPVPAAYTQSEPTTVTVLVHAADTGNPLPAALVSTRTHGIHGTTDHNGVLRITSLPRGTHTLEAQYLGYARGSADVEVVTGQAITLRLELPIQPLQLAAVRVIARRSLLENTGFNDRRSSGFGTFVSRDQIVRMQPRLLSDVLRRVAGINFSSTPTGGASSALMRGTKVMMGDCPIQYYIDGTMTSRFNVDDIRPDDVEGMEIYRGAATIPPAYNKGTALCGVVLIWTRDQ